MQLIQKQFFLVTKGPNKVWQRFDQINPDIQGGTFKNNGTWTFK